MVSPLYISLCAIFICHFFTSKAAELPFDTHYTPLWGGDHVSVIDQRTQVQIKIDPKSGGGFRSKQAYGSGFFQMSVKIPSNAKGIATTFYLTSTPDNINMRESNSNHDELDFEFILNEKGRYVLNTNVFAQDSGNREQQFNLWFDPSSQFHNYQILWNQHQIVFYIDRTPIRVFKNERAIGARYPSTPMYVHASLWNGSQWLGPVNWRSGPFYANYRGFAIDGCDYSNSNPNKCNSLRYSWNAQNNWQLDPHQQMVYQATKNKYIIYDYCKSDRSSNFPECRVPS
ncbi:hypothetical protein ACP275_03G131100 [Erythranthe tilingii]